MVVWMSGWTMPMVVMGVPLLFVFLCILVLSIIDSEMMRSCGLSRLFEDEDSFIHKGDIIVLYYQL